MSSELMRLIRMMVVKETRTTMRERHQKAALALVFVLGLAGICVPAYRWAAFAEKSRAAAALAAEMDARQPTTVQSMSATTTAPSPMPVAAPVPSDADMIRAELLSKNPAALRWAILMGTTLAAMMFALGLISNAAIAAFAGEKEAKTLELALASPASDGALFVGKCAAAVVPGVVAGYLFILLATLGVWALLRVELAKLPFNVPWHTLVLSVPLIVLPSVALALVGVAGSARAETVKGAGQVIGIAIMVFVFVSGALPALLRFTPLGPPASRAVKAWLDWPFPGQYFGLIGMFLLIDVVLFAVGRSIVRRHQMLV